MTIYSADKYRKAVLRSREHAPIWELYAIFDGDYGEQWIEVESVKTEGEAKAWLRQAR